MAINRLAVFGDSWIYGDELIDPSIPGLECCDHQNKRYRNTHSFSALIAEHFQFPHENFGHPGASLQSTIWTFLWFLENRTCHQDTLCLVGLTGTDRQSWFNPDHEHFGDDPLWNKFIHSTWVNFGSSVVPPEWRDFGKQYLTLSSCNQLSALNYLQAVMFFDGVSKAQGIPLLQFNLYDPHTSIKTDASTLLWPEQNLQHTLLERPDSKDIHAPGHHPNEQGHQIISELLIPEIKRAILT